jgi:hypothetical protein
MDFVAKNARNPRTFDRNSSSLDDMKSIPITIRLRVERLAAVLVAL